MSSEPARNLVHGLLLAAWAVVGVLITLGALIHPATLVGGTPLGALLVHGGLLLALGLVPHVFPLSLLRAGLDILGRA